MNEPLKVYDTFFISASINSNDKIPSSDISARYDMFSQQLNNSNYPVNNKIDLKNKYRYGINIPNKSNKKSIYLSTLV